MQELILRVSEALVEPVSDALTDELGALAVSVEDGARLLARTDLDVTLTRIGEVIAGDTQLLRASDGTLHPLPRGGWEHALD